MSKGSTSHVDRTLTGATTLGQSGPGSDGNEEVLCIPQSSLSDCLISYAGHSLWGGGSYLLCLDAVGVFYCTS